MKALNNHNNEEELPLEVIDIPTDVGIPPTEDIPASDIEKIERQANVFSQIHSITMQPAMNLSREKGEKGE